MSWSNSLLSESTRSNHSHGECAFDNLHTKWQYINQILESIHEGLVVHCLSPSVFCQLRNPLLSPLAFGGLWILKQSISSNFTQIKFKIIFMLFYAIRGPLGCSCVLFLDFNLRRARQFPLFKEFFSNISCYFYIVGEFDRTFWFRMGCYSAATAVALGAFGAHGLKKRVADPYLLDVLFHSFSFPLFCMIHKMEIFKYFLDFARVVSPFVVNEEEFASVQLILLLSPESSPCCFYRPLLLLIGLGQGSPVSDVPCRRSLRRRSRSTALALGRCLHLLFSFSFSSSSSSFFFFLGGLHRDKGSI